MAFSERLLGSGQNSYPVPSRDFWPKAPEGVSADQTLQACQLAARPSAAPGPPTLGGRWWFWDGREWTKYTHAQQPNGPVPDCLQPHMIDCSGMVTARSRHLGGVNALMADGATRFVKETIDLSVSRSLGRAMGTRCGLD